MSVVRWALGVNLSWRALITFDRRRNEFLDWAEDSLLITQFYENDEGFGIAINDGQHRLLIDRESLRLRLSSPDAEIDSLADALTKALHFLEPEDSELVACIGVCSSPVSGDYEDMRRALTRRSLGPIPDGVDPYDVAILWDGVINGATVQNEFGVVDDEELVDRITRSKVSRVAQAEGVRTDSVPGDFIAPPVSVLSTTTWRSFDTPSDLTGEDVLTLAHRAQGDLLQIAALTTDAVESAVREGDARGKG